MRRSHIKLAVFFLGMVLLTLVGIAIKGYAIFHQPMHTSTGTMIRLTRTASASTLIRQLSDQQLIDSPQVVLWLMRARGMTQRLQAGVYDIHPHETLNSFLWRVIHGDVLVASFRIVDGMTKHQVAALLAQAPYLKYAASDWANVAQGYGDAEGLLLADTYYYDADSSAASLLNRARDHLLQSLNQVWAARDVDLPYTDPYQLLIVASILEKETAHADERRLISGVIVNRLKKNMPLQMDPTVIYGLGEQFTGKLTHEDMQLASPYNTYRHRGLPPTPIAMVGKAALDAAAHPQHTNYLYFVAKGDGRHQFSESYDAQRAAISHYLR